MHRDDPDGWDNAYSQQPYQSASSYYSGFGNVLGGLMGATSYYLGSFSGMGQQQWNAQMGGYQTALGTPVAPKPTKCDPSEIAWLKGRIKDIEWRP